MEIMDKYDMIDALTTCIDHEKCEGCKNAINGIRCCNGIVCEMTPHTMKVLLKLLQQDVLREKHADDLHEQEIKEKDACIARLTDEIKRQPVIVTASGGGVETMIDEMTRRIMDPATITSYTITEQDGIKTTSITISTDTTYTKE